MEKEKKFIIKEEQREEVFNLIKNHSWLGARTILLSLEELKEPEVNIESKKEGE
ncbi:MAG: hypothetical protein KKF48_02375 [Nanoarchaeota archaeon]|nr:hypothetical protein [Nanoarchaeota archaeon]MBU1027866.1 hypothetical protein [Nanoarchaeota archaeon]